VEAKLNQVLRPPGQDRVEAKEIELAPDDLEYVTYEGEDIPLDGIVEEHILLSLPMQPLCDEECKGLCAACGANLNRGDCGCPEAGRGSPFDSLKEFVVKER
jgi:uncharacterized protein